jgi:acetolactate synthase-1/3 small subunit
MTNATVVADAQDSAVTINRVVSLLRGRYFAIVSFTAAKSHLQGVARLTIVIDAARTGPARVAACLSKLADVWNVQELVPAQSLRREMVLVRVRCPAAVQLTAAETAGRDSARVVYRDSSSMILEIVAEPEKLDRVLEGLALPIVEFMRSGALAMSLAPVPGQAQATTSASVS